MKRLRFQFTLRRMMIVVGVVALGLFAFPALPFLFTWDDVHYNAVRQVTRSWDCGPAPSVNVDILEGSITVLPSTDSAVTAEITAFSLTDWSQWDADRALDKIEVTAHQKGNSVEIVARGASPRPSWLGFITNTVDVVLRVPQGIHLDLRVGQGRIDVGEGGSGGKRVPQRVIASSIAARNDSEERGFSGEGNIFIETAPPAGPARGDPGRTRLQLDAAGHIKIHAENALVEAQAGCGRSFQGEPPEGTDYWHGREGSITFDGTLAEGPHTLRARHSITMQLPASTALRIDADAAGSLLGDPFKRRVESEEGRSRWKGAIGNSPSSVLILHTDDGPITLSTRPEKGKGDIHN